LRVDQTETSKCAEHNNTFQLRNLHKKLI